MPTDPQDTPRPLPDRPNLRHLKDQAKDLLKAGLAKSLGAAQFEIARLYGFASWPKLKAYVGLLGEVGQLKDAIDRNDLDVMRAMMTRNPALHRAPLGYGKTVRSRGLPSAACRGGRQAPRGWRWRSG